MSHPLLLLLQRLLLSALLLVPSSLWATCLVQPHYPLPQERSALHKILVELDRQQDQCLRSSTYYAWRGTLQLALGQYSAATESLERALLLQPDLPGAQLDYAQVLLIQGDRVAALDLLRLLAQRRDLPPHIRTLLVQLQQGQAQEQTLTATAPPLPSRAPLTRWRISSAFGWDSNLNSAPHTDSLTLSIPGGGGISLPLERSSQPQPGLHALSQLGVQQLHQFDVASTPSAMLLSAQLTNRSTRTESKTSYQHSELAIRWLQAPQAQAQWLLGGQYSHLRYGGQPWLNEWQLSAQRQRQWGQISGHRCSTSAGGEWVQRRWRSSPELDSHYQGTIIGLDCARLGTQSAYLPTTWGLQLRWGHDLPDRGQRPGGRYIRTELRAHASTDWGAWQLGGSWYYQTQRDSQGYSPLLEHGRHRRTYRHALDLQASRPLFLHQDSQASPKIGNRSFGQIRWFIGLQYSEQRSNIAIFGVRQYGIHTGLRWIR